MLSALLFLTLINYRDVAHDFLCAPRFPFMRAGCYHCYSASGLLMLLSLAGFEHYFCKVRINLGSLLPNCDLLCKF